MNWKKILLYAVGGGFAGSVGHCLTTAAGGGHCAFTAGNILLPALITILATLAALFTHRPQDG